MRSAATGQPVAIPTMERPACHFPMAQMSLYGLNTSPSESGLFEARPRSPATINATPKPHAARRARRLWRSCPGAPERAASKHSGIEANVEKTPQASLLQGNTAGCRDAARTRLVDLVRDSPDVHWHRRLRALSSRRAVHRPSQRAQRCDCGRDQLRCGLGREPLRCLSRVRPELVEGV